MKSPPKEKRGRYTALETAELPGLYRVLPPMQRQPWWLETERLAAEFRRTHQERHLQALARHLDGVFERLMTGGSVR
jgi:hypothetical protein